MKIALIENVTTGLAALSRHFKSANSDAESLQRKLNRIARTSLIGGGLLASGGFGLKMLQGPLDKAKKFEQEVSKFKLYGLGDAVTQEAASYAKAMKVMGGSATENMALVVEAQGIFRESGLSGSAALEGAKLAAPMLAKIAFATESLGDETKSKMRTQAMAMMRFVELRGGLKDAATFNSIADAGWKAIQTSGGNVNWEQLRQFMAKGGVAAMGLSNESLYGQLEPVIGELKGTSAGAAWMTAYNRLVGAVKVPNQGAHLLAESGIWDASKIKWNSLGGVKTITDNPLKDMATLTTSPTAFYEKNILPMYAKMHGGHGLSQAEKYRENTMIFGSEGGKFFSLIDRQLETSRRSVEAQSKALGVDASVSVASQGLAGKEADYEAKLASLKLELGQKILPMAVAALERLNAVLETMTQFAKEHPIRTEWIVKAAALISVAAVVAGAVLLVVAPFILLGGTVTAFIAIFTAGALAIWSLIEYWYVVVFAVKYRWNQMCSWIATGWDTMMGVLGTKWSEFKTWMSGIFDGLIKMVMSVVPDFLRPHSGGDSGAGNGGGSKLTYAMPSPTINQQTHVYVDGKEVAARVTNHVADGMDRAPDSGTGFDGRQSLAPTFLPAMP